MNVNQSTPRWKYAVNTNSLSKDLSYARMAQDMASWQVDGVEWGLPALDKAAAAAKEMVKASRDNGLQVAAFLNAGNLTKTDLMRQWSEAIVGAGIKNVPLRVAPFWTAWDYRESIHQRMPFPEMVKRTREGMEKLEPLGKEYGLRYVVEMHPGNVAAGAELARRLMDGLDPRSLGVIYDPANGLGEGHLRPRSAAEILGPYLAYVHVKNLKWVREPEDLNDDGCTRARWNIQTCRLDEGILDWVEVFFALNVVGFSGWLALEEFIRPAPQAETVRAVAFLKECARVAATRPEEPFTTFND